MSEKALHELAGRYRESLRRAVYLIRSLDVDDDLSTGQVSTLNIVAEGPVRVSEIARKAGVRVPSATEQIIRLENAGLVQRTQDDKDARAVLVSLTAKGDAALTSANHARNIVLGDGLAQLTQAERDAIAGAIGPMNKLNSALTGSTP
ncbi:winged helix DNA-binding protein [Paeniglutamicibacter antarcticus]|uniref:Winged helix DNA-binding protein n=1 Tax=Arthrobacter terrae TaxID=2935737 RepID=A0A931G5Z0_9MICC|nr:MarR family transcriptional regulator [Arthrobacter terrae]MBG0740473.1 winged helix DNA-binding protein [Arthrobacter terrae]